VVVAVIIACEIGFWVVLGLGLLARYALRMPRTGAVLLACVPLVDLILLVVTVIDLRAGATATAAHGLAAAYLGFSVAFGHRTVTALDRRIAHRFDGGPAPAPPPRSGPGALRHAWAQWGRAAAAWAVACGLLCAAIVLVDDAARTAELAEWLLWLTVGLGVWLVTGPLVAHGRSIATRRRTGLAGQPGGRRPKPPATAGGPARPTGGARQ